MSKSLYQATSAGFLAALQTFAAEVTGKFSVQASFNPEDQLKSPVEHLLRQAAHALGLKVEVITEVQEKTLAGRPDMGVATDQLLAGYVELKAPGKGADPIKFKGQDKAQWDKFKDLPNLIYTDGNAWALYRDGGRVGELIRLAGDITQDSGQAIAPEDEILLLNLLRTFFNWHPLVPSSPRALAEMLAPLCRLLRGDVIAALTHSHSNLSHLAGDWRSYLFPDADDRQFADAYAQTLTYALLLAQLSGTEELTTDEAVKAIRKEHRLLAESLRILSDPAARSEIDMAVSLLERVIAAVDVHALSKKSGGDPWLYFYEDFLAVYDPKMRKDGGVYYTPVPVVQTQIKLVAELLRNRFDADYSFVDKKVVTLDPATGTGTYILAALQHGLKQVEAIKGKGMRASAATLGAENIHGFEILVGPYAVAHLRFTQQIMAEGGAIPKDGIHVYLTDTLEPPNAEPPGYLPLLYKPLGEEHKRAQKVKAETPVLVCIGNPPYDRQIITEDDAAAGVSRKGGWVRYGDEHKEGSGILKDFIEPLNALGLSLHAKNLYNDYVYFWRWAMWKVFESQQGPGIVSFITASSYLTGPSFMGMRKAMREMFDELWIIDLEGDNLGARKTENVFAIQTPVAITTGACYQKPNPAVPAQVRYTRMEGSQEEKLARLDAVENFASLKWRECPLEWTEPFLPLTDSDFFKWPLLTDVFPWQENGVQFKRSWPIGETQEVLQGRWYSLLTVKDQRKAFRETGDRKVNGSYPSFSETGERLAPLTKYKSSEPIPNISRYAYRSFDRRYAILDSRFGDRMRPDLQRSSSDRQIYLTGLLTNVYGKGPAAAATDSIPDLHHFCNRGAKDVIPLWRDREATRPNITHGIPALLEQTFKTPVAPEDLFVYAYALLASPRYVETFWEELTIPGPRLPLTQSAELFAQGVEFGRQLIWLHTYGERFVPANAKPGKIPPGQARCKVGTPSDPADYPDDFDYDPAKQELYIGKGVFEHVRKEVWEFGISGFEIVKSWLGYRKKSRTGKKSSPLDEIRPQRWDFDDELLNLLWVLEHTLELYPALAHWLDAVIQGPVFAASELPKPRTAERERLAKSHQNPNGTLF